MHQLYRGSPLDSACIEYEQSTNVRMSASAQHSVPAAAPHPRSNDISEGASLGIVREMIAKVV